MDDRWASDLLLTSDDRPIPVIQLLWTQDTSSRPWRFGSASLVSVHTVEAVTNDLGAGFSWLVDIPMIRLNVYGILDCSLASF